MDGLLSGRRFPDKAIDVVDEACSTAKLHANKQTKVTSIDAPKELIVLPSHVEQVGFRNHIFRAYIPLFQYDMFVIL
jgi:hypothetical protein